MHGPLDIKYGNLLLCKLLSFSADCCYVELSLKTPFCI